MSAGAQKRGDDAADHAPKPEHDDKARSPMGGKQDAPNYAEKPADRDALNVEDVDSSNDEGAA